MDKTQRINYANFAALICYIVGRVMHLSFLVGFGLAIMTAISIWTVFHWKENSKMTNYISVAFLVLVGISIFGL